MSETNKAVNKNFAEVVEDYWARAWVMRMGVRTPEVSKKFADFVEAELRKGGAFPPEHWKVLSYDADAELDKLIPAFVEYLAEW